MFRYAKPTLIAALTLVLPGISYAASAPTATQFTVNANQAWQPSGVVVSPGSAVQISSEGGAWTANPATGMVAAGGNPRFVAKPGYTLPGALEGQLVGRVGSGAPFVVGNGATVPPGLSGPLEFSINDDLQGMYGAGLRDNIGSVTVKITH